MSLIEKATSLAQATFDYDLDLAPVQFQRGSVPQVEPKASGPLAEMSEIIAHEKTRLVGFFSQVKTIQDKLESALDTLGFSRKLNIALEETASLPNFYERMSAYRRLAMGTQDASDLKSLLRPWLHCLVMPGIESSRAIEDLVGMAHLANTEKKNPELTKWLHGDLKEALNFFHDKLSRENKHLLAYQLLRAVQPVFGETFDAAMQDSYQQLSEEDALKVGEIQKAAAPSDKLARQLEKTIPTLLWLHQFIEGSYQQRLQEAETKNKPTAFLLKQRQKLRDYLATVHAYLRSGKATGTEQAIERLADDFGKSSPRDFYIELGKIFEYQVMDEKVGIADHILQLVRSETISDPKIQASVRFDLLKRFIVDDSISRRAEAGIAAMAQHLASFAAATGDSELQNQLNSLKKFKPYLQATNRVLDHVFSLEGFGISMASMFTAGLVGEIAAFATAMRMGALTMESMTLGQKLAVGAVRFGANWAAFNASETVLKSGVKFARGENLPSAKELRLQLVNSFFSLGGGHLATTPFAYLGKLPYAGLGRFLAFSAGMVKGEDVAAMVQGLPQITEPFLLRFYEASLNAAFLELGAKAGKPVSEHLLTQYLQQKTSKGLTPAITVIDRSSEVAEAASGETGTLVVPPALTLNLIIPGKNHQVPSSNTELGPFAPSRGRSETPRGFFDSLGRKIERSFNPDVETLENRSIQKEIDNALQDVPVRDFFDRSRIEKWFETLLGYTPKNVFRNRLIEKMRLGEFNRDELREILTALREGRLREYDINFLDSKRGSAYARQLEEAMGEPIHRWLVTAARDTGFVDKVRDMSHDIVFTVEYLSRGIFGHPDRPLLQGFNAGEIRSVLELIIQLSRNITRNDDISRDLDFAAEIAGALCRFGIDKLGFTYFDTFKGDLQRLQANDSLADRRLALLQFVKGKADQMERQAREARLPQIFDPNDSGDIAYSRAQDSNLPKKTTLQVTGPDGEHSEISLEPYDYRPAELMPRRLVQIESFELTPDKNGLIINIKAIHGKYIATIDFETADALGIRQKIPNSDRHIFFVGKEFALERARKLSGPFSKTDALSLAHEFGLTNDSYLHDLQRMSSTNLKIEDVRQSYAEIVSAKPNLNVEIRQALLLLIASARMHPSEAQNLSQELRESKVHLSPSGDGLGFFKVSLDRPLRIDEVISLIHEFESAKSNEKFPEPAERFGDDAERAAAYQAIAPQLEKLPTPVQLLLVDLISQGRIKAEIATEIADHIVIDELGIKLLQVSAENPANPSSSSKLSASGIAADGERYTLHRHDPTRETYNPSLTYGIPRMARTDNTVEGGSVTVSFHTWQGLDRAAGEMSLTLSLEDCVRLGIPLGTDGKLDQSDPRKIPSFILLKNHPIDPHGSGKATLSGVGPAWRGLLSLGAGIAALFSTEAAHAAMKFSNAVEFPVRSGEFLGALVTGSLLTLGMVSRVRNLSGWVSHAAENAAMQLSRWVDQWIPDKVQTDLLGEFGEHPYRLPASMPHSDFDALRELRQIQENKNISEDFRVIQIGRLAANPKIHDVSPMLDSILASQASSNEKCRAIGFLANNPNFLDTAQILESTAATQATTEQQVTTLALIAKKATIMQLDQITLAIRKLAPNVSLYTLAIGEIGSNPNYRNVQDLITVIALSNADPACKLVALAKLGNNPNIRNYRLLLNTIAGLTVDTFMKTSAIGDIANKAEGGDIEPFLEAIELSEGKAWERAAALSKLASNPQVQNIFPVLRAMEATQADNLTDYLHQVLNARPDQRDLVLAALSRLPFR